MCDRNPTLTHTDTNDLFIKCAVLIDHIAIRIKSGVDNQAREVDLAHAQIRFLKCVYEQGKKQVPMKDVQQHLGGAPSTTSDLSSRLAEKGFITTERSSRDNREKQVTLTEKGEAAYLQALTLSFKAPELNNKELILLYELLEKLDQGVNEICFTGKKR